MTNLSPAALSVWCRFCEVVEDHGPPRLGLARALRAAADQVVPVAECRKDRSNGCCERSVKQERSDIRILLRAIAFELEDQ